MQDAIVGEPSKRRARFLGSYDLENVCNDMAKEITNTDCPMEVEELQKVLAAYGSRSLRDIGITVADVLRHDLSGSSREQLRKDTKKWLNEGGSVELLELCSECCDSPKFKKMVCELATKFFKTEFDQFTAGETIRQPTRTITPKILTSFSSQALSETYTTHAPYLAGLFKGLLGNDGILGAGPLKAREEIEHWIEDDDVELEEILSDHERLKKKGTDRQTVRWVTAFSIMCYTRTRKANLFQMVMGYYLVASDTPKCVFEVLHGTGFSVAYTTVVKLMKRISTQCFGMLRDIPKRYPRFSAFFDNMDFQARVRDLRLDHQGILKHYCAAFIFINLDGGGRGPMLTANDIDVSRALKVSAADIFLSNTDQIVHQNAWHFGIYSVLQKYCAESMSTHTSKGKQLNPINVFSIHQIPVQKSRVWTLPVFNRNEGNMGELSQLFKDMAEALGLCRDDIAGSKIFSYGDLFTVLRSR